jgi:hypothetical protein
MGKRVRIRGAVMYKLIGGVLLASALVLSHKHVMTRGGFGAQNVAAAQGTSVRVSLFDGETLRGWQGDPAIWSVKDSAIHGVSDKGSELILSDGDYADFRLILKSKLVSESNHLGVCFWGARTSDWGYGECILVIPPTGHMWDYHPGMSDDPSYQKLPHPDFDPHVWNETEILAHLKTGTVRVAVNGVEVTRYTDKNPARLQKGPIGLQIHSGASEVEYKDIEIEVDPKANRLVTVKHPDAGDVKE